MRDLQLGMRKTRSNPDNSINRIKTPRRNKTEALTPRVVLDPVELFEAGQNGGGIGRRLGPAQDGVEVHRTAIRGRREGPLELAS